MNINSVFIAQESYLLNDIDRIKSPSSGSSTTGSITEYTSDNVSIMDRVLSSQNSMVASPKMIPQDKLYSTNIINNDNNNIPLLKINNNINNNNDFLQYIDPLPTRVPSYKVSNPNKSIRYPIFESAESCSHSDKPPQYTPTVDKFTIVSTKSEWLSPYEPATSKAWKNCIMEINSTQLNFYYIDNSLTERIKNYSSGVDHTICHIDSTNKASKFIPFKSKTAYNFSKNDQEHICYSIQRNKEKYLNTKNLYKSYSLQFAKFGIPIDYNKKTFVLRLRCESEQFLVNFAHVDDMISWTTYLSMGISVSLDLDMREMPDYRIVPRRRRRRGQRNKKHQNAHAIASHGRRTREKVQTHLADNFLFDSGTFYPQFGTYMNLQNTSRKNTNSSHLNSNSSAENSSNSESQRSDNYRRYSLSPTIQSAASSSSNLSADNSSNVNKNSNGPSPANLKSKLKGFFKIGSTSKNTCSSISSSPPSSNTNMFRNYSTATSLNSLMEDDNESDGIPLPGGMQFSRQHSIKLKSVTSPLYQATQSKMLAENESICPKEPIKNFPAVDCNKILQRNNAVLQHELNELHQVIREHQESDDGEEEDDEDDTFEHNEHKFVSPINDTAGDDMNNSVYLEEGIFHEADYDEHDYYNNYRRRASSVMSALSYAPYGSDEVKWCPRVEEPSRRRQIRNSLRCIRPFLDDNEWVGFVCFKATKAPVYKTNNKPIWFNCMTKDSKRTKFYSSSNHGFAEDSSTNMKNHYLEAYVVGPVEFMKANDKAVRCINKMKSKKYQDDNVEYQN